MVSNIELSNRLRKLRAVMSDEDVDSILIVSDPNVFYLSGMDTGRILVTRNSAVIWVKEIYTEIFDSVFSNGFPLEVRIHGKGVIKSSLKKRGLKKVYVDEIDLSRFKLMKKGLGVGLKYSDVMEKTRYVKTRYEISQIVAAGVQAKKGMEKAYQVVKSGVRELDAVADIESEIRRSGSVRAPFGQGMLLAGGVHSANIHAEPRLEKIRRGTVIADLGGNCNGYFSDMTRTIAVGRLTRLEKSVMEFVENVELSAIDFCEPGITAGEIHQFVEDKFTAQGYKTAHPTGHGVGLKIHEAPYLGFGSKELICENVVFTVEPGVYLPKKFGVRFEDTIIMGKKRARIITR